MHVAYAMFEVQTMIVGETRMEDHCQNEQTVTRIAQGTASYCVGEVMSKEGSDEPLSPPHSLLEGLEAAEEERGVSFCKFFEGLESIRAQDVQWEEEEIQTPPAKAERRQRARTQGS